MIPCGANETAQWRQELKPYFSGDAEAPYAIKLSTAKFSVREDGKLYLSSIRRVKESTQEQLKADIALCLEKDYASTIDGISLPASAITFAAYRERAAVRTA